MPISNEAGKRYTRLVVIDQAPSDANGNARWNCICDCGKTTVSHGFSLRNGASKSCGCLTGSQAAERNYRHGKYSAPEYITWADMLQRCNNPKAVSYPRYGGRGIRVCQEWHSFPAFYADMGSRPTPKHTIDRRDNSGNYEPKNCYWATKSEQNHNKRNNHYVTYRGERMTLTRAIEAAGVGITFAGVKGRLARGWAVERAVETPPDPSVWANRTRKLKPA